MVHHPERNVWWFIAVVGLSVGVVWHQVGSNALVEAVHGLTHWLFVDSPPSAFIRGSIEGFHRCTWGNLLYNYGFHLPLAFIITAGLYVHVCLAHMAYRALFHLRHLLWFPAGLVLCAALTAYGCYHDRKT